MAKYTDEQIKKMLDTIIKQNEHKVLNGIPNSICCLNMELTKAMRDLINRQEAEIERLRKENAVLVESNHILATEYVEECTAKAKSEAVKEFAEKLKNLIISDTAYGCDSSQHTGYYDYQIQIGDIPEYIENLLKEMLGEGE